MCVIEAGIDNVGYGNTTVSKVKELLLPIEGVADVQYTNGLFEIECTLDLSTTIAQALVTSGFGLTYLNKKEYGLDDIYNRYFEGGISHE